MKTSKNQTKKQPLEEKQRRANLVCFTVWGNQEDREKGNPIPYTRTTQRAKFSEKYKKYCEWKDYVVAAYSDAIAKDEFRKKELEDIARRLAKGDNPIRKDVRGKVSVVINFRSEKHGDPDNIIKGILDALFQDDKHIDVQTHHNCHADVPRVYVILELKYGTPKREKV